MDGYDGGWRLTLIDRDSVAAFATLVRLPNLFTAPPDVIAGAALATGAGYSVAEAGVGTSSIASVGGLALASMLLYAAGTTLNDYFDADEDARERPDRPIPAGEITPLRALTVGVTLLFGGIAVATVAAGILAGTIAGALGLTVLLYDGVLKGTIVGFLCMGCARALNVLLGTTVTAISPLALPPRVLAVTGIILVYIASVTYLAEYETTSEGAIEQGRGRSAVIAAIGGIGIAVLGVLGLLWVHVSSPVEAASAMGLLVVFLIWSGRPLRAAYVKPGPETIGPAVGACVVGLIGLDAAIAVTSGVGWGLTTIAFAIPAIGLSRVFNVT